MRTRTYNRAFLLIGALKVVEDEAYKKWLAAELVQLLGYPSRRSRG
jgi:hypothetical protein